MKGRSTTDFVEASGDSHGTNIISSNTLYHQVISPSQSSSPPAHLLRSTSFLDLLVGALPAISLVYAQALANQCSSGRTADDLGAACDWRPLKVSFAGARRRSRISAAFSFVAPTRLWGTNRTRPCKNHSTIHHRLPTKVLTMQPALPDPLLAPHNAHLHLGDLLPRIVAHSGRTADSYSETTLLSSCFGDKRGEGGTTDDGSVRVDIFLGGGVGGEGGSGRMGAG